MALKLGAAQQQSQLPLHRIIQRSNLMRANSLEIRNLVQRTLQLNSFYEGIEDTTTESIESLDREDAFDVDMAGMYERAADDQGYKMQGDSPDWVEIPDDRKAYLATQESLLEDLELQIGNLNLSDRQRLLATWLIQNIDAHGFIEEPQHLYHFAESHSIATAGELEQLHDRLKTELQPIGLLCSGVKECLLLQIDEARAKDAGRSSASLLTARSIIEYSYDSFLRKDYDAIARSLRLDTSRESETFQVLEDAYRQVDKLVPFPVTVVDRSAGSLQKKEPDFIISWTGTHYTVKDNQASAPKILMSKEMVRTYEELRRKPELNKEALNYYKEQFHAFKEFEQDLKDRHDYSVKLITFLVNTQRQYLESGNKDDIQPLVASDVAQQFGITPQTVYRVASNKLIVTDEGEPIQLRELFSLGFKAQEGQRVSRGQVKGKIREMILSEPAQMPMTDQEIHKDLAKSSVVVGMLSISKLRYEMGVPDSKARFRSYQAAGKEAMLQAWGLLQQNGENELPGKEQIRSLVKDYITKENGAQPLTDLQIEKRLKAEGLTVTHKQVEKIRTDLGFKDSRSRRTVGQQDASVKIDYPR